MAEDKNKVTTSGEQNELKAGIANWQVAFIGIGGVIGSCYFLGIGYPIGKMGPAVFLAFLVVSLIVYGTMICYSELLVNVPRGGSFVAYTSEFVSPTISTGFGWAFWFNWVCYVPSEAIAVSTVITALMHSDSMVTYVAIALGAMAAISIINLGAVDVFAKIESGLAITKVIVIFIFILAAFGIWVGLWGQNDTYTGFLAGQVNFGDATMSFGEKLFPMGFGICITNMTIVLVTMQGTEIVGLTAAESKDPTVAVPKACKSVVYRIGLLYLIPILLCLLVYPFNMANDENPVFADIMYYYHLDILGYIFAAVVMVAAFSCANTGFYGTVRALFGLSVDGLAPKALSRISKSGNPRGAAVFTLIFMWAVLSLGLISEVTGALENLYSMLLSLSGFTGAVAWLGIVLSWF
ncbi:MAG: amino acid permease, partial [Bacillota bacterium]|nr:amino acid permease [Bacillota bacterium]